MAVKNYSRKFSNGVTVVNCTPHPLNFLSPEGETVVVPCSVPEGEKTGEAVISASSREVRVSDHLVKTEFLPSEEGLKILDRIEETFQGEKNVMVVGSIIAMNAYPGRVVGMIPAPGFERVPPAQKLMSVEKFNTAQ